MNLCFNNAMRAILPIIAGLAFFAAGCASDQQAESSLGGLPVLVNSQAHPVVPDRVLKQLTAKNRKVMGTARDSVHSLGEGLAISKAASTLPITAAADTGGWYFYANATFTDASTGQPVGFISGVAIKHGGKEVVGWSIW
jgi:hypothetical protein